MIYPDSTEKYRYTRIYLYIYVYVTIHIYRQHTDLQESQLCLNGMRRTKRHHEQTCYEIAILHIYLYNTHVYVISSTKCG